MNHVCGTMHVQKHDITRNKLISRLVAARLKEAKPKGRQEIISTVQRPTYVGSFGELKKLAFSKWST